MQPLDCEVKVEYWHAERKVTRFSKQLLEITKDNHNNIVLLIPPKTRKPYQYKLQGNIQDVIAPKIAEGRLTFRLTLPDIFVYIEKANPEQLKDWVTVLNLIKTNPRFDIEEYFELQQQKADDNM